MKSYSSIQQLPGFQKFIFDAKYIIPTPKNLLFNFHDHFFGKWPLYLDQDGSKQDPATARCPEIYFDAKYGIPTQKNI